VEVRHQVPQGLVRSDRPTELPAIGGVASRLVEDRGGRTDCLERVDDLGGA
jgi:hypothetical protein